MATNSQDKYIEMTGRDSALEVGTASEYGVGDLNCTHCCCVLTPCAVGDSHTYAHTLRMS
eukprot:6189477-Pleurochrysis_carterae.AAC.4